MSGTLLKLESPLHDKQPNRRGITTKVKNRINDDIDHFVLSKTTSLRITTAQTTTKTLSLAETTTMRTNKILSVNQQFNKEHTHISSKNESTSLEESRPTETETAGTKLSNKRLQECSVSKIDHKKSSSKDQIRPQQISSPNSYVWPE
uniref:Uncharacterized protein n=1 Tax=Ciona intestinalis TaxID=7719 RepID=F7BLA8_CIOIN